MNKPKDLSGSQKRKLKKARCEADKKSVVFFQGYVKRLRSDNKGGECSQTTDDLDPACPPSKDAVDSDGNLDAQSVNTEDMTIATDRNNLAEKVIEKDSTVSNIDWQDPAKWPNNISDSSRVALVKLGPTKIDRNTIFPFDTDRRRFTIENCYRTLKNGEKMERSWLIYSETKDSVYCFCCKLFGFRNIPTQLQSTGFRSWRHLQDSLNSHEKSKMHVECMTDWKELKVRLDCRKTIDDENQNLIQREETYWKQVLERLVAIIKHLAKRNMAFRGTVDRLYEPNNGNFLSQVELMAKFDPILSEHVRRVQSGDLQRVHYLGKETQNEFIDILGNAIFKEISRRVVAAKYYSIILDCTSDISHEEQMTAVVRFVTVSKNTVEICKHFIGFVVVDDTTGKGLYETLLDILKSNNLELNNCRGQGYDNGSNMKGKNSGAQARILKDNKRAFFVSCSCHNLNLVVSDAGHSSVTAELFFGVLQRLFAVFAASTQRWQILKEHVNISLKSLPETRWEGKINAVKAVRFQIAEIRDALQELCRMSQGKDAKLRSELRGLCFEIESLSFLIRLVVWYDVLQVINKISKALQCPKVDLHTAMNMIDGALLQLQTFRESGFETCIATAKKMAEKLDISQTLPESRTPRTRRFFDYESQHDERPSDPMKRLEIEFFNKLCDIAISSLRERFEMTQNVCEPFSIIRNSDNFMRLDRTQILTKSKALENYLTGEDENSDIDGRELAEELESLKAYFVAAGMTDLSALVMISHIIDKGLDEIYPNFTVTLRIFLTLPVTSASGERTFSKLKLIKTYLRSTMCQDRLNGLAAMSIEHGICNELNFSDIIASFANKKSRKVPL
ncbi:zinc finger MYM-type protein 1-like [Neodiprion pinetum]|uniref:zinc finger MYM-type protein 1-like n=1 Tax=Neodiprion pinetum TaxID=441929 RepID=UPI001EDF074F|nr:zinc finger MYM-type protein 1-like [Neodiprion pinetum]